MKGWLLYAAKAVVGGGIAFTGALGTALADGHVTPLEWTLVAGSTLAVFGGVLGVTNGLNPAEQGKHAAD